jgi:predicted RNase H-like nuclease (RuvC/YqgF family)
LASEQQQRMLVLDADYDALESKVAKLEVENLELRAEIDLLKREVEQLRNEAAKSVAYDGELDDIEVKILQTLSSARDRVIAVTVAMHLGISQTKTEYYLGELENAGFIYGAHFQGRPTEYSLIDGGREYLERHRLT